MQRFLNRKAEIIQHLLKENDHFPNNPSLPLLIYKKVFDVSENKGAKLIENVFEKNKWSNCWRNGIYDYHHYHSNTHEVLGVYSGHCIVQFGGEHGVTEELRTGDLVVIPAGVTHKKIAGEQFKCVGAYPNGVDYNIHYGKPGEKEQTKNEILKVPLPDLDPAFGGSGPIKLYWTQIKELA